MRRTLVEFEVRGSNHKDLVEQARIRYAEYVGVPDAPLPPATSMQVRSDTETGDGTVVTWVGEVTVTVTS